MTERRVVEATAPTRIDLAGRDPRHLAPLPLPSGRGHRQRRHRPAGLVPRGDGRTKACASSPRTRCGRPKGSDVSEVLGGGALSLVAHILRALGIETGVKVVTQSRVPAGSGLGGSSALAVAVAAAACARPSAARSTPTGCGRSCATRRRRPSACPRACRTTWPPSTAACSASTSSRARCAWRSSRPIPRAWRSACCSWTPASRRFSGINNWEVFKGQIDGQRGRAARLGEIVAAASGLREALVGQRYDDVGGLMAEEWEARKRLAPGVTTPEIDRIAEIAAAAGRRGQGVRRGRRRDGRGLGDARPARRRSRRRCSRRGLQGRSRSGWTCAASRSKTFRKIL